MEVMRALGCMGGLRDAKEEVRMLRNHTDQ